MVLLKSKIEILKTTELIEFSISWKFLIGLWMVLGYFILYLGFRVFSYFPYSFEYRAPRSYKHSRLKNICIVNKKFFLFSRSYWSHKHPNTLTYLLKKFYLIHPSVFIKYSYSHLLLQLNK